MAVTAPFVKTIVERQLERCPSAVRTIQSNGNRHVYSMKQWLNWTHCVLEEMLPNEVANAVLSESALLPAAAINMPDALDGLPQDFAEFSLHPAIDNALTQYPSTLKESHAVIKNLVAALARKEMVRREERLNVGAPSTSPANMVRVVHCLSLF